MYSNSGNRAYIQAHFPALRRGLKGYPELLESLEAGETKASGRVGANVTIIWKLAMRSLYSSADIPVLGTREVIQNAADAIRDAIKKNLLKQGQGRIEIEWDPETRQIDWNDNGIGMSSQTILERFLVLGESGKRNSGDSEMAGGFGIAKAVILGTSSTFRWRMHTLDNDVICDGWDKDIEIKQAARFIQGTRISAFDVSPDYLYWWDPAGGPRRSLELRLKELLGANDLPGIRLTYNDEEIHPLFSRRGGSPITVMGSWGHGTTATVKAYKRPDRLGAYWIRLNGLLQFKQGASGDLGIDVVIDLSTTVRPGDQGYPLNAARDSLQGEARNTFRALSEEVERENISAGTRQEDEVFDAEGALEDELSAELSVLLSVDPTLSSLFALRTTASTIPEPDEAASETISSVVTTELPDDHVLDLSKSGDRIPWFPPDLQTPNAILQRLQRATIGTSYRLSEAVVSALESAAEGRLSVAELKVIANEMDSAARLVGQSQGITIGLHSGKVTRGSSNPFGHLGALRISKINYPQEKARALRRSPRKWLPHLLLWSTTLKLMAEAAGIFRNIKPGFILENGTIGLAQKRGDNSPTVIYIHPDRLAEVISANRLQPIAIAGFLHGVGAHELAHADGRLGQGHSESLCGAPHNACYAPNLVMQSRVLG